MLVSASPIRITHTGFSGLPGGQLQQMLDSPALPQRLWSLVSDYVLLCRLYFLSTLLRDRGFLVTEARLLFRDMEPLCGEI